MSDPTIETREELFMSAAAGESVTLPDPETTEEVYLAKAAGETVTLPSTTNSRIDVFLKALAEGGGGGGVVVDWAKLKGLLFDFASMSEEDQQALVLAMYNANSWEPVTDWFEANGASALVPDPYYSEAMIASCAGLVTLFIVGADGYMTDTEIIVFAEAVNSTTTLLELLTILSTRLFEQDWWPTAMSTPKSMRAILTGALALMSWANYIPYASDSND